MRLHVTKQIAWIVTQVAGLPKLKSSTLTKLVRRRCAGARVQPVHEFRRLEPTQAGCRLIRSARVFRQPKAAQRIGLIDHLLADFVFADAVDVRHRTGGTWIAGCVGRIAWIADGNELDAKRIPPTAESVRHRHDWDNQDGRSHHEADTK